MIYTNLKVRVRGVVRGRTWDRTDMGSLLGSTWPSVGFLLGTNGHGIPSWIAVTFRMIPTGNEWTWDWTDMGSLLGSSGIPSGIEVWLSGIPSGIEVGFLLGLKWDSLWDRSGIPSGYDPCPLIRVHLSLRADSVVWLSHTSSIWSWSGTP